MVNPINGDKPIAVTTERSGESTHNRRSERTATAPSAPVEPKAAEPASTTVEVEGARQRYDLETQAARVSGAEISSPEAARSVLDQLLEQIGTRPEQALQAQGSGAKVPLAKLLQAAPA
jgi:cytoskeletal protein RodZ